MNDNNTQIGELISHIRHEKGLTQAAFASLLGTSQSAINRIEHGKQNLSIETIARISDVLNQQIVSLSSGSISLRIEGGHELRGEIAVKTSKNAVVGLLCACLINKGTTTIKKAPRIEEVNRLVEVLKSIGASVRWINETDLEIKPPQTIDLSKMDKAAARKTRSVIMFIGSIESITT